MALLGAIAVGVIAGMHYMKQGLFPAAVLFVTVLLGAMTGVCFGAQVAMITGSDWPYTLCCSIGGIALLAMAIVRREDEPSALIDAVRRSTLSYSDRVVRSCALGVITGSTVGSTGPVTGVACSVCATTLPLLSYSVWVANLSGVTVNTVSLFAL